jgi:hypothetical protein
MKSIATFLVALFLFTCRAVAQPVVSYIIPDIGARGMNTYVEIIGPNGSNGNFGSDGLYLNGPTDPLQVVPVNAGDAPFVVVGPLVVSWGGRMISTQIFVKDTPTVGTRTIPFRVVLNGASNTGSTFNFDVVTPQTVVLTSAAAIGSGGTAGTRSKRGAMIVDRLDLSGGNYTVSTADPDASTPGNQGYLPFILIAKNYVSIAPTATLRLNGGTPDAAPGGGGGAGQFCDLGSGSNGGNGYSGGGAGGRNNVTGGGTYQSRGVSTGTNGGSLNGALGGDDRPCTSYEGAGGGTGHPFGQGGDGYCTGSEQGRYGGGSTGSNLVSGGGGGYANDGTAAPGNALNKGRAHGNREGIPIAGGSGGGSGNPQGPFPTFTGCAGAGGGAGGAVALYSMVTFTNSGVVSAIGGNGGNASSQPGGGGGSGGYIAFGSKLVPPSSGGNFNSVAGGAGGSGSSTGGAGAGGRSRFDGFTVAGSQPQFTAAGSTYIGLTIDTLTYTESRNFTVRGTYDGTNTLRVYYRTDNTQWQLLPAPTTSGRTWSVNISLPFGTPGGNYYFTAMQQVSSPSTTAYLIEPQWVMSQVAANIVRVNLLPKINGMDSLGFKDIVCERERFDTVKIWNEGDVDLSITGMSITGTDATDFSIVSPTTLTSRAVTAPPLDTQKIVIRFAPTTPGVKNATLRITNNDNRPLPPAPNGQPRNPWQVKLVGRKRNIQPSMSANSLDFGNLCKDAVASTKVVTFQYTGDTTGSIRQIIRLGSGTQVFDITDPVQTSLPKLVTPPNGNGSIPITVRFRPTAAGTFADSFRVVTGPCDSAFTFTVRGTIVEIQVEATPDPLDFGNVRVNTSSTIKDTIRNAGASPGRIKEFFFKSGSPPFTVSNALVGRLLAPNEKVNADITFSPTATGVFTGQLCVVLEDPNSAGCLDTSCITLTGRGVTSLLLLSRRQISLSADSCADPAPDVTDTFKLYNRGLASVIVRSASSTDPAVTFVTDKSLPHDLAPNDSILFTLTWKPGGQGTSTPRIEILTASDDPSQQQMIVALTLRRDIVASQVLAGDGSPLPSMLDFGMTFQCASTSTGAPTIPLRLHNSGTLADIVTASFTVGSQGFSIAPASPYTLAAGGADTQVDVSFTPTGTGEFRDTLLFRDQCGRETRVPMVGSRYTASIAVQGVTFGTANVGFTKRMTATVTNTSNTPNSVRLKLRAFIKPPVTPFKIAPTATFPISLAPGESGPVDIDFTPTLEQPEVGEICFYYDNNDPCPDTVCALLTGTGIKSNVLVRQSSLNFGAIYLCQMDTLTLTIENTGSADLDLTGLPLSGTDAAAFEQLTPLTFPTTIPAQQKLDVLYRFIPGNSNSDGLKTATVTVQTSDASQPSIAVQLIGERRTQLLATPVQLNFGRVLVGTSQDLPLLLENRTTVPLRLEKLIVPPPFQVIGFTPPVDIPALGSITVTVRFTPTDTNYVAATLIAAEGSPCIDTARIPVTGQGKIIQQGFTAIDISDSLGGEPGDRLSIPILLKEGRALRESEATTFIAAIRFDKTMLLPVGVRSRTGALARAVTGATVTAADSIISNVVEGNDRIVTVRIANSPLPQAPDTLGFLDVKVLLGDSTVTPITIDTLFWTDGDVTVSTEDGIFTLQGYCTIGGDRLVQVNGTFGIKSAAPNPFNPSTEIIFETVERGATTLAIHDAQGRLVATLVDGEELPIRAHVRTWNAERVASGIYYAVLTTPTQRSTWRLVVLK